MNKLELETIGYTKDFFPFSKDEIKELKKVANSCKNLSKNERKRIFKHYPIVKSLFNKAIQKSKLDLELTEYCFYIEKSSDKNWPLMMHRDINLPDFLGISKDERYEYLKNAVMFRLNLDSNDKDSGALKVKIGSHISDDGKEKFIEVEEGEVVFFKPLLLHGSNKMTKSHTRRVFQALCINKS